MTWIREWLAGMVQGPRSLRASGPSEAVAVSDDLRRLAINYFVTHEAREALYADDVFDGLSDEEIGAVNGERVRLTGRMMEIEAALREAGRNLLGDGACQSDAVPNVRGGK